VVQKLKCFSGLFERSDVLGRTFGVLLTNGFKVLVKHSMYYVEHSMYYLAHDLHGE
jgi:hypothetical protein